MKAALGRSRRVAVHIFFACALTASSIAAGPATAPASPKELFAADRLHTIEIRMSAPRWNLLEPGAGSQALRAGTESGSVAVRPGAEAYAYVKSEIDFDGQTVRDVGIRFKGNMSYTVSAAAPRRPMKLDFERFAPGQRFARLAALNLNNQALDPSQGREALAFELFRELGVPAARTGFALVYLKVPGLYDHEFLGLYTLIEEVDRKFLKKHFADADGLLLKPQGMRGLAYFGEDWRQYEGRYRAKGEVNPALTKRILDLARLVHRADDGAFAKEIDSLLDVDEFLKYVLVNAALCNFDSFLSTGHNYYIYVNPADGRASFIPWDMNMAFGGYTWVGTQEQIADVSIVHPYVDHNRLIARVLAVPRYREVYQRHARTLIEGPFSPSRMRRRIADVEALVRQTGAAARSAGRAGNPTTHPSAHGKLRPPDLSWFVENRVPSIRTQLEGTRPGFVPGFREPELVPQEWEKLVRPAAALIAAMDDDHDGRLSEQEISRIATNLLRPAADSIDSNTATASISALLTEDLRKCGSPKAWADWLFRVADENHDGRLDAAEMMRAYRRLLAGADFDFDAMMGGRELIEALAGTGVP
jgi:hypothetical protein